MVAMLLEVVLVVLTINSLDRSGCFSLSHICTLYVQNEMGV